MWCMLHQSRDTTWNIKYLVVKFRHREKWGMWWYSLRFMNMEHSATKPLRMILFRIIFWVGSLRPKCQSASRFIFARKNKEHPLGAHGPPLAPVLRSEGNFLERIHGAIWTLSRWRETTPSGMGPMGIHCASLVGNRRECPEWASHYHNNLPFYFIMT